VAQPVLNRWCLRKSLYGAAKRRIGDVGWGRGYAIENRNVRIFKDGPHRQSAEQNYLF
jgi:hypothetical protein